MDRCAVLFFQYVQSSAVSVAIWIPRRRWDLCARKFHQFGRDPNLRVVGGDWRCRAQEFFLGLWYVFEMAVESGRSTLGSEIRKELKRLPSMVEPKLDCQLMSVVLSLPYLSTQEGGCEFISVSEYVFIAALVEGFLRQLYTLLQNNMTQ